MFLFMGILVGASKHYSSENVVRQNMLGARLHPFDHASAARALKAQSSYQGHRREVKTEARGKGQPSTASTLKP